MMVKVLGMRYDFGREIVEGDMSPLASALMPVDDMPAENIIFRNLLRN